MNRKKMALWGGLLLFAVFVAWTALSIPDHPEPVPESERKPVEMTYGQNTIREEAGGKLLWELTTASTAMDVKSQATRFTDAKGKYYFPDGKELTLTAPSGNYDSKTKNVKLSGGVTAVMSDGTKLICKELEWVSGKDLLVATGDARVEQPGMRLEAERIEGWDEFKAFRATGKVHFVQEKDKKGEKAK